MSKRSPSSAPPAPPPTGASAPSPAAASVARPAAGPAEQRRLQMADIARLAGVSVSTVSRALSGSTLVNAETRQRVAELARSLNYSINLGAQNLRLQKNRTVAVVVPFEAASRQHISDPFFLALVGSIADALTDQGYDMLLSRVDAEHLDLAAQFYDSGKAIGVIMVGQWRHHDQLNALAARQLPLVVWGGALPQQLYCTVGGDNADGGLQATRHLLALGRRRIAFLGDAQLPEVWLRREGYHQALKEAGLRADPALELALPFEPAGARLALERWLPEAPNFDAVVACSDLLALQAIHTLRARGRVVPDDVAVVGYDDMPLAAYCDPPLSTVHQPVSKAGTELVAALMAQLRGERSDSRTLGVNLIVRRSAA
ncbi:LacI family DNA-binding transcriptional regulator [Paucibacter sp. DJ2R-2]|uniref:LacI family DNA-binding transcriptional regulator n=1 Tax=Paucibacter sp. DJ2R-2 TaxID=2893558 RepID=UPI0021E49242|nr:LacI family DNA-binding transcriptional regulator [Paucibacter sp. DJ2R-2]MCV2421168.1 LacI family DNA-binding transcriptional regulator [Paucibacter sp. DJ4R-1]MCV2439146.1 LacI family DNA-binding transcriptional regulator [Paucibacter sp. DJ2R-2]